MKSFQIARITGALLGVGVLAGCGASTATAPLASVANARPNDKTMKANFKKGALIYVTGPTETYVVSYNDGSIVGTIDMTTSPFVSLCSDKKGNVFIPNREDIWEYKHGGTTPVAQLDDSGYLSSGCSVDPTTRNLAVSNLATSGSSGGPGNIAIYAKATGKPTFYTDSEITGFYACVYDDSGNLYVTGGNSSSPFIFAELPKGSSTFEVFNLNKPARPGAAVEWDGKYVDIGVLNARLIYRVKVAGSTATVVGTTRLDTLGDAEPTFWLHGGYVLTASGAQYRKIGFWKYPRGGKPVKQYGPISPKPRLGGLTLSVSPRQ